MTSAARTCLLVLVACGGSTPAPQEPEVVGNTAESKVEAPPPPKPCSSLTAKLRDAKLGEPLIGATVVGTGDRMVGERVAITDENGAFSFAYDNVDTLTIYYLDFTKELFVSPGRCDLGTIDLTPP